MGLAEVFWISMLVLGIIADIAVICGLIFLTFEFRKFDAELGRLIMTKIDRILMFIVIAPLFFSITALVILITWRAFKEFMS